MDATYWHKQLPSKPLYPDLLWSRPENKAFAGKLLIIGGNAQGFVAPGEAYRYAEKAGAGSIRMLLPESMRPFVGKTFTQGELAPVTPSGSFSQLALGMLLNESQWADGVLLAGDFGRNSETAILLEKYLQKHDGAVTLTKDAVDYFTSSPATVLQRPDTTLVLSFAQLQRLAMQSHFTTPFTFAIDLVRLVDALHEFTLQHQLYLVTKHLDTIFVAANGEVSSSKLSEDKQIWRVQTAATTAVWWLQNRDNAFAAMTTAIAELR